MFYPLKFKPVYKSYLWGGRNLESLGRQLPDGPIAESWEISAHPDGVSVIANGNAAGTTLSDYVGKMGRQVLGESAREEYLQHFPLLVKLIDANQQLSVQVHPDDVYARSHETEFYGKSELWYIISARPGSQIIYHLKPGVTKDSFARAIHDASLENCLNYLEVHAGDVINIPAGIVHALGEGIVLAEIQQNSNATYRLYDYDRVDASGNKRPLHIEKALEVIDFNQLAPQPSRGTKQRQVAPGSYMSRLAATPFFNVEYCEIDGRVSEAANGRCFYLYTFFKGEGMIHFQEGTVTINAPESVMIPAQLGSYAIEGKLAALKIYISE